MLVILAHHDVRARGAPENIIVMGSFNQPNHQQTNQPENNVLEMGVYQPTT